MLQILLGVCREANVGPAPAAVIREIESWEAELAGPGAARSMRTWVLRWLLLAGLAAAGGVLLLVLRRAF